MAKKVKTVKEEILDALKEASNDVRLPGSIAFAKEGQDIAMILTRKSVALEPKDSKGGYCNMQENAACFEGWSIAIAAYYLQGQKLILKVEDEDEKGISTFDEIESSRGKGHFGRFLYRALRFSEQYKSWFVLSDKLQKVCDDFSRKYVDYRRDRLINNIPNGVAGVKDGECVIEMLLSENKRLNDILDIKSNHEPHRQLPVGLFVEKVSEKNCIFTGGKSAIDLWLYDDTKKELNIVELKWFNKMIGIVTEVFFYSNYINDFVVYNDSLVSCEGINKKDKEKLRGYDELLDVSMFLPSVVGVMLNDKMTGYHPLVNDMTLSVLNDNGTKGQLKYRKCEYDVKVL